jgi:hypothetical protein
MEAFARRFGLVLGLGLGLGLMLASPDASARELEITWRMGPPTLRLQPESARLVLDLPAEWMPPPDLGALGVRLDPNKTWHFRTGQQRTSASIGQGLRLQIDDRERALWFGLSVMPRAAVAELRFDPMPAQVR